MGEEEKNPTVEIGGARAPDEIGGAAGWERGGRGRGRVSDRDLTQGSITKNLWLLAGPAIAENVMNTVDTSIDMIWVGRLGAGSIAAVGVGGNLVQLISTARMGLTTGTRAMVSRFVGADDLPSANHATLQAFVLSAAFAFFMATIGIFFAKPMLQLLGLKPDVIAQGLGYVQIAFVGSAFMSFRMNTNAVLQASGDMMTPMKITALIRIIHVVIDPFLIFGWLGLPRMGVTGAAVANLITQAIGSVIGLYVLFTGYSRLKVTFKNFRVDFAILWRMIKIGIPATISSVERSFTATVLLRIIATFGTYAIAAHTLGARVEMFAMSLGWGGLATAVATMVGQNLGARKPERAERSAWVALGFYWLIMAILGTIFLLQAENVIRIFNSDPELVKIGSTFLRIAVAGYLFMAPAMLLSQALGPGAGDTVPPMLVSIVGTWGIELPLAVFLPRITSLGVYGVRWASVIAMAVRAVAITGWFRQGRWKLRKV